MNKSINIVFHRCLSNLKMHTRGATVPPVIVDSGGDLIPVAIVRDCGRVDDDVDFVWLFFSRQASSSLFTFCLMISVGSAYHLFTKK